MPEDYHYLKTARILVVDDIPGEAIPIMTLLGKMGIGCVYQKGDRVEDFPEKPFMGIRLVFLDLRLDQGGDSNQVLSKTVTVLKTLVDPRTAPLLVICWTKHEADVDLFRQMAIREIPGLKPGFIRSMPKPKGDVVNWDESNLLPKISEIIEQFKPLQIIWDWEQVIHDSVSQTTQTLADAISDDIEDDEPDIPNKWDDRLLKVFRSMVKAESGETADKGNAQSALFNVLNALVSDRINHTIFDKKAPYSQEIIPLEKENILGIQRARLNQMLLTEPIKQVDIKVKPGNIYLPENNLGDQCLHKICKLNYEELIKMMVEEKKFSQELSNNSKPFLVEISPSCDFSQNKRPVAKFIAGVLFPENHIKLLKKSDDDSFMKKLAPLLFHDFKGEWVPVFNSRYQFGVADPDNVIRNRPVCRFRSQALVDIQAWASSRSARPGILSIG